MTRLEANKLLLERLAELIETHPHLRFGQILYAFDFLTLRSLTHSDVDFYREPEDVLKEVNCSINKGEKKDE